MTRDFKSSHANKWHILLSLISRPPSNENEEKREGLLRCDGKEMGTARREGRDSNLGEMGQN